MHIAEHFDPRQIEHLPHLPVFGELLIECDEDRTLRAVLVGMLRETG